MRQVYGCFDDTLSMKHLSPMHVVVLITASGKNQARRISKALVEKKLVACVNEISNISSVFWWKGKVDTAREVALIAKSTKSRLPLIVKLVKAMHSYEVPEIIALPIIGGNRDYLDWIDESIR